MQFTCDKNDLSAAITKASRAAAQKSAITLMEGLLIEASANVTITGFDLRRGIYTKVEANVVESGSIVLNCRLFGDIIRRLPDGIVTICCGADNMTSISCMKSEFKIMGLSSEEYPLLPDIDSRTSITMSQAVLKEMITQTQFAVSDNPARPVYTGALFDVVDGELVICAVDGFRLALRREPLSECNMPNTYFIVPQYTLQDLEKICTDPEGTVRMSLSEFHICFALEDAVLISRRVTGEFLNYNKSVPSVFEMEIGVKRTELSRTVDRVGLIIQEKIKSPLLFTFDYDMVKIQCQTSVGNAEDICFTSGDGGGMKIGFNHRFMMDALRHAPADELKVCINNGSSPAVILPADGNNKFKYMILPVRIRAD